MIPKAVAPTPRRPIIKIINLFKLIKLFFIFSFSFVSEVALSENELPREACPDVSGSYSFYGKNTPGMPDYYRVRAQKLSLELMLGIDLSSEIKNRITHVKIAQSNGSIQAIFMDDNEDLIVRKLIVVNGDSISCSSSKLEIHRKADGRGEAVSGVTNITITLAVEAGGDLVVRKIFSGWSRTLIFFWPDRTEEYEAHFSAMPQP